MPDALVKENTLVIKDDTITVTAGKRGGYELTFTLDESKTPKTMDEWLVKPEKRDKPYLGIYSLEGDTMTWCFSNPGEKRPTEFTGKAGSGWTLTVFKRAKKAAQDGKQAPDEEKPVAQADLKPVQGKPILSSDEFRGKWTGEKDGVKVDLTFNGEQARWQAHWQVEFKVARTPENPQQPPTVGVNMGAELKSVPDVKAGRLNLYLPRYTGNDEEFKHLPAFNGGAPVGQIEGGAEGTLQLRILPIGYKNHAPEDEYPAVEGCRRPDLADHAAVSSVGGAKGCLTPGQGNVWLANLRATADSHTPLKSTTRSVTTTWPPSTSQRIPDCFSRCVNTVLQAASVTPLPIGKPTPW